MVDAGPAARNAPCPCGSGRRYKHCHGASASVAPLPAAPEPLASADPRSLLERGLALQEAGNLGGAQACLREVLAIDEQHPDAWHLLGLIDLRLGQAGEALAKIERAIAVLDEHPQFHLSKIKAALALPDEAAALDHARRTVRRWPDLAAAWCLLGSALLASDPVEARHAFEQARRRDPQDAAAAFELARILAQEARHEAAVAVLEEALAAHPVDARLLNNLALSLEKLGRGAAADAALRRALAAEPGFAPLRVNLGRRLFASGSPAEALQFLEPPPPEYRDTAEYWLNLALARQSVGRVGDALEAFREAHRLQPDNARIKFNLGSAHFERSEMDAALPWLEEALRQDPGLAAAQILLLEIARRRCAWDDYRRHVVHLPEWLARRDELMPPPHAMVSLPVSAAEQMQVAMAYTRCLTAPRLAQAATPCRSTHERLRLGYLTTAVREHPTMALLPEVLERHDRSRYEVFVLSCGPRDASPYRARVSGAVEHFIDMHMAADSEVAQRVVTDEIDILIDLDGYTQHSRAGIFAARPASMQVNYLGFPGTLGSRWHDYVITDRVVTPPEMQKHFTERFLYLPHCYLPSDTRRRPGALRARRADWGLPEGAPVFCSFNHLYKLLPEMFDGWMAILRSVPAAVLWILAHEPIAQVNLRREAAQRGVAPERLIFAGPVPMQRHLERYVLADLFLDNLPCNAHTTCNDALLMGLPVLTCLGDTFAGRVAASHLQAVGLPELITRDLDSYQALAIRLAQNPPELARLRQRLAATGPTSPLFDMAAYTSALEDALATGWEMLQDEASPASA